LTALRNNQSIALGNSHQGPELAQFLPERAFARCRESIVPSTLVITLRGRSTRRLFDESFIEQSSDASVQVAGLETHTALSVLDDVLSNAIAVALTAREHREDEEIGLTEGGRHRARLGVS